MMDPEARFLQNQEARTAARRKHNKTNDSHVFWKDLRDKLSSWRDRLATIAAAKNETAYKSARDRQEALHVLDTLQEECKQLQTEALSASELPVSDLRLLHQEFATCAQQLYDARNVVSPPTRFVFARYRAAWNEREKQVERISEVKEEASEHAGKPATKASMFAQGRVIQNLDDATIIEESDGAVRVTSGEMEDSSTLELSDSTSLVLQDLRRCQVTINASYHLLHLINLIDCKITCSNRIDGAIHVTGCTDTNIAASCHQLRIHDCTQLEFKVQVGSGPILEDSSGITFVSNPGDTMMQEIKDFNWFRSEPSPNYEVVERETSTVAVEERGCADASESTNADSAVIFTGGDTDKADKKVDDDDDDEL